MYGSMRGDGSAKRFAALGGDNFRAQGSRLLRESLFCAPVKYSLCISRTMARIAPTAARLVPPRLQELSPPSCATTPQRSGAPRDGAHGAAARGGQSHYARPEPLPASQRNCKHHTHLHCPQRDTRRKGNGLDIDLTGGPGTATHRRRNATMIGSYGGRELGVVQMDLWVASGGVASRNRWDSA